MSFNLSDYVVKIKKKIFNIQTAKFEHKISSS